MKHKMIFCLAEYHRLGGIFLCSRYSPS